MHDQPVEAQRRGAVQFVAQRVDRLAPERRIRGREIDQVAVVRDDRPDLRLPHPTPEQRDFLGRQLARAPLPGRLREDLQRLAAARLGPVDGTGEAAGNGKVSAETRHDL